MMKRKLLLATALFLTGAIFAPLPCAARKLSAEEKSKTHSICVSSELGDDAYYLRTGTTVFNNFTDKIPAKEILGAVKSAVEKALRARGYSVVGESSKADYVLVMQGGVNVPRGRGNGIGVGVGTSFGIFQGMGAGGQISFRLKDSKTGKVRASAIVDHGKSTGIRKAPNHWSEFTPEEKARILEILKSQLLRIP